MLFQEIRRKIQITKKERKNSSWYRRARLFPIGSAVLAEKASPSLLSRLKKASLTVETAVVLPIFLFAMITLSGLLDLYGQQSLHLLSLCERAKEAGVQERTEESVVCCETWSFRPAALLAPLPELSFSNEVRVHSWSGREEAFGASGSGSTMVYVTEYGSVFHRDADCRYIHRNVEAVAGNTVDALRNQSGEIYHACERCSRGAGPAETVYLTESGNRYHNDGSCSALKRSVRLVPEGEAQEGMRPCSHCGEEE